MKKDYEILFESFKRKEDIFRVKCEREKVKEEVIVKNLETSIIKTLIRCKKMYEAKQEIVRILYKAKKRDALMGQLDSEFRHCSEVRAKGYYYILLKLSCRMFNQIERLRVDNPMLNRPFVYDDKNLQVSLVRDCLNLRNNLIKQFKGLKNELDRVLDKSGKIVNISNLIQFNKSLNRIDRSKDDSIISYNKKKRKNGRHFLKLERGYALSEM